MRKLLTYIIAVLLILAFHTCKNEMVNPYDRECPAETWTPSNLIAEETPDGVLLSWEQSETNFDGYVLELSFDGIDWIAVEEHIDSENHVYIDASSNFGIQKQYRIKAIADLNQSDYCVSNELYCNLEKFTDVRDGNEYKITHIGDQVWMAENLAYLPSVNPRSDDDYLCEYYYVYDYDGVNVDEAKSNSNYQTYGVLYNWSAALSACPAGWHLPSDEEWKMLELSVGMSNDEVNNGTWRGTSEGNKLKASSTWSNDNGTNEFCFSALASGTLRQSFNELGETANWWTSTEPNGSFYYPQVRTLKYDESGIAKHESNSNEGHSIRCVQGEPSGYKPIIATLDATNVSKNSVTLNGEIESDGGSTIMIHGFCYNKTGSPSLEDFWTAEDGGSTGKFSILVEGNFWEYNTTYYLRAFAMSSAGIAYGDEIAFTTPMETFIDSRDENEYKMVQIGEQVWMAENLAYLPEISISHDVSISNPYYYVYFYTGTSISEAKSSDNYKTYGVLYNWPAALNACPSGWHLPTDEEWSQLEMAIGMNQSQANDKGWRGTDVGTKLKATNGWFSNGNGSDDVSFGALPGGKRYDGINFGDVGKLGYWWSATVYNNLHAWHRILKHDNTEVYRTTNYRGGGLSVRCVKD